MQREIKFRAWNRIVNRWQYFELKDLANQKTAIQWQNLEIMQFSGLQDKNGKDIYEGDVLEEDPYIKSRFEVVWDHQYAKFRLDWTRVCGHIQYPEWNRGIKMAIIGNIYSNPELLIPAK